MRGHRGPSGWGPTDFSLSEMVMQLKTYSASGHDLLGSIDQLALRFLAHVVEAEPDVRDKVGHKTVQKT